MQSHSELLANKALSKLTSSLLTRNQSNTHLRHRSVQHYTSLTKKQSKIQSDLNYTKDMTRQIRLNGDIETASLKNIQS